MGIRLLKRRAEIAIRRLISRLKQYQIALSDDTEALKVASPGIEPGSTV